MKVGETLYVTSRRVWRSWLAKNYRSKSEIWLIYYKKASGKTRIPYNDAVDEALCYGWIDSTVKSIDKERFAQRFTPRRGRSVLSQMNRERVRKLVAQKRMTKAGLKAIAHVFDPATDVAREPIVPPKVRKAFKENPKAWQNFQRFPDSYKRIRIAFIESRKRHGKIQFQKSLDHFIDMTAKNKRFGFVKEMS
jgi:uncharacterized protein YdeI (YjbR/CyaY-like superfamily)